MISTYTNQYRLDIIQSYLGQGFISFLINMPSLGVTDTPTSIELNNRMNLIMSNAVAQEASLSNGYKRNIITLPSITQSEVNRSVSIVVNSTFTATGGNIGPVSHICYARGADISGASNENGNNRGSTQGILIFVEPIVSAPITIQSGATFSHTTTITISNKIL